MKEYYEETYQLTKAFFYGALGGWLTSVVTLVMILFQPAAFKVAILLGVTMGMGASTAIMALATWRAKHKRDMAS